MNSAPSSTGVIRPAPECVWIRPPMRARASSTVTESPAAASRAAPMSPAAPAPSTATSQSGRRSAAAGVCSKCAPQTDENSGNYALFGRGKRQQGFERASRLGECPLREIETDRREPASRRLRVDIFRAAVNAEHLRRLRNRDDAGLGELVAHRLDSELRVDFHEPQRLRAQELEGG